MTLVERLRLYADASVSDGETAGIDAGTVREAADRIEELEELDRKRRSDMIKLGFMVGELEAALKAVWRDVFENGGPIYSDTGRLIYRALNHLEKQKENDETV